MKKYTLLRGSKTDQRIFSRSDNADNFLYFADHSGDGNHGSIGSPNQTDDGPLKWEIPTGHFHENRRIILRPSKYGDYLVADISVISEKDGRQYKVGIEHGIAFWLAEHHGCMVVLKLKEKFYELFERDKEFVESIGWMERD
jgi:hypothetical protein